MRVVSTAILNEFSIPGKWRWLDAGEKTKIGDLWDFDRYEKVDGLYYRYTNSEDSVNFVSARPGYEVMGNEDHDVMRRIE